MVTIGLTNTHYEMIIELIDSHLQNMINQPTDEIVLNVVNDWLDMLRSLNDDDVMDLVKEYESILDDMLNGY